MYFSLFLILSRLHGRQQKKVLSVSDQFTFNSHSKRVACFQRFISISNGPFINTSIFYKKIWRKLKTDSSKKRGGRDQKDRGRSHTMFTRRGGWLVQKLRLFVNVYKLENVNARGMWSNRVNDLST